jgi:SH3-like domain-containing protein
VVQLKSRVSFSIKYIHIFISVLVLLGLGLGLASSTAMASEDGLNRGRETGYPLPRFASLKFNTVNLRVGPGRKFAISWQYQKHGLPVEIIQEFHQWRRIRDAEGSTGWVLTTQLSSRRTGIVAPWEKPKIDFSNTIRASLINGKASASVDASTVARLQAGLMVTIEECESQWCEVEAQNTRFWLKQDNLWGVYPNEIVGG